MSKLPILLVPGLGCTAEVFAPQIPALWPFGPVTVANALDGDSMAEMAASILATAPPRFALGGISMGGYLAFEILRQAPERVLKLALIDTSARPDPPEAAALRRARVAMMREGRFAEATEESFAMLVHPDHVDDRTIRALSLRMNIAIGAEAFSRQQEAIIARPDSRPGLGAVGVPTLMIVGEADQLTPPELAREIADGIPGARLVVVPKAGHMSLHENPEAVNAALVEWLRG